MMTAVMSASFWTAPWLNHIWASVCRTSCSADFTAAYVYLFPGMLGLQDLVCVLTLEDLQKSDLGWLGIFFSSLVVGGWTVTILGSSGGYLGAYTCSVSFSWLMSRSMLVYGITGSSYASSVAWNSWGGYCRDLFLLLSSASLSNPVISVSPIGQPLGSVKINWSG